MGRPAQFDREQAVEIAMNEIWMNGFEACSIKAISEKLGITRSSFYNAFQSREALFEEALELYFSQTPDRVLAQVDSDIRIVPMLTKMFRDVCRARAADPQARGCMAVNCVAELVGVNEALGPMLERAVLGSLERLEHLIEETGGTSSKPELSEGRMTSKDTGRSKSIPRCIGLL